MLTFCIPTWNRARKLRKCLASIVHRITKSPERVRIFVYDNASDDQTPEVLAAFKAEYPDILEFRRGEVHVGYAESFRNAFLGGTTEWTWCMGDDDLLTPTPYTDAVLDLLKSGECDFYHVAEAHRSAGTERLYPGPLLDLCCQMGFIEMTGFISGNICRTELLHKAFRSPNFDVYAKSSFVHSLCLLETLADRPAAFVDVPAIILQDQEQTPETLERWHQAQTSLRYNYLGEGLNVLRESGIIPRELPERFFRYLGGNIFGKIAYSFWLDTVRTQEPATEDQWVRLFTMTMFLPVETGRQIRTALRAYRQHIEEYAHRMRNSNKLLFEIEQQFAAIAPNRYPETYIDPA